MTEDPWRDDAQVDSQGERRARESETALSRGLCQFGMVHPASRLVTVAPATRGMYSNSPAAADSQGKEQHLV